MVFPHNVATWAHFFFKKYPFVPLAPSFFFSPGCKNSFQKKNTDKKYAQAYDLSISSCMVWLWPSFSLCNHVIFIHGSMAHACFTIWILEIDIFLIPSERAMKSDPKKEWPWVKQHPH